MKQVIILSLLFMMIHVNKVVAKLQGRALIDSLNKELPHQKDDSNKVNLYISLANANQEMDVKTAAKYDSLGLELASKLGWKNGKANIYVRMGKAQEKLSHYSQALVHYSQAQKLREALQDDCEVAYIHFRKGICYDNLGKIDSNLIEAQKGLDLFKPTCDSIIFMQLNVTYTNAYLTLGEYSKVLKITEACLGAWNEKWPNAICRNGLYTNRAIAIFNLKGMESALDAFRDILRNAEKENIEENYYTGLNNMAAAFGVLYQQHKVERFIDSLEFYHKKAIKFNKDHGNSMNLCIEYMNIAVSKNDRKQYKLALAYADSAYAIATDLKLLENLASIARTRSQSFYGLRMIDSTYNSFWTYSYLKDSLLNTDKVKAITEMEEKYESEKKERTIKELELNKVSSELNQTKLKKTRNIVITVGIIILLLAIALWSRLNYTRRSRALIQKEKQRSDDLLLNILPAEVAEELKTKGLAEAKQIDEVTVLFTDFKDFTQLSEKLTPKELVGEINECFSAFDHIMQEYGVEKIKTIGDAYMAAGGLPTSNTTHANDVVNAAVAIQKYMNEHKASKEAEGKLFFDIRIGVHSGPVVAGIVGVKKFAYDIWGDTVNTASRMESSGEVGQVNISGTTYKLVKDKFNCIHRGKIDAKGKGEIDMYFVEGRI